MSRFVLDKKGVRELLQSEQMAEGLNYYADKILSRVGEGYAKSDARIEKTRADVIVYADSRSARADNSRNNTLLKALGGLDD